MPEVSIHAAREGGDLTLRASPPCTGSFNPRRPRGRRQELERKKVRVGLFQSTPPARAATGTLEPVHDKVVVSIHAAREGGDGTRRTLGPRRTRFNPRRPRGRRPEHVRDLRHGRGVSIHAAREGGDAATRTTTSFWSCFNPRRPRGRRHGGDAPLAS